LFNVTARRLDTNCVKIILIKPLKNKEIILVFRREKEEPPPKMIFLDIPG